MKYIYQFFIVLLCAFSFASCGDDDFIEIDSLSTDGDEFYCNQKVKVWMCVRSSDLWHTNYEWSCDAGSLTQPQGLNEMTWKAPSTPGTYTITCRASIGGESQVRSHKMYVSSYYFDKFEKTPHSLSLQGSTTGTLKKESNGNQYLQAKVNSAAEVNRYLRRAFGDNTLYTPFSTRMKLGFDSNVPNMQEIVVGKKTGKATLEYRWNLRSDASNNGSYINQIRLIWYPGKLKSGEVYPAVPNEELTMEGTTDYNVQLIVQYTSAAGKKITYNEYHNLNTMNTFTTKLYQTVSMSVDENEAIIVHVAGQEVLKSNILKDARTENSCEGRMSINNWELYIPNGDGGKNIPLVYIDDAYASNTGILE